MLIPFLYRLRSYDVPVGTQEILALAQALKAGLHDNSILGFYYVARSLLIHHEGHLDAFDQAFLAQFRGFEGQFPKLLNELLQWLDEGEKEAKDRTQEEQDLFDSLDPDELRKRFEETLAEQKERHDGGDRWIGTDGESAFGRAGKKGGAMRVGDSQAQGAGTAVRSADARKYRSYRSDLTLDLRQIEMALKRLRSFSRQGADVELDLDGTIAATADNGGELEVRVRPESRPNTRVILMMDVGGSMDPYARLMSQVFSATKKATHWKELRTYYFHNCIYGRVYRTESFRDPVYLSEIMHECGHNDYKLILVGDALMGTYELVGQSGALSESDRTKMTGLDCLIQLRQHFRNSVWLNPEHPRHWSGTTISQIRDVFDMYHLTLEGLTEAMTKLATKRR